MPPPLHTSPSPSPPATASLVPPNPFDAHLHLFWLGEQMYRYVDLAACTSIAEVQTVLRARAQSQAPGTPPSWYGHPARALEHGDLPPPNPPSPIAPSWILARGLNPERLIEKRLPIPSELEEATGAHPTLVTRICGHVGVLSHIPGHPDGLLEETPFWTALATVPPLTESELHTCLGLALSHATAAGLAGACTMLEEPRQLDILLAAAAAGAFPIPITANLPGHALPAFAARGFRTGQHPFPHLRIGAAKFFADGTLGARTAFLSEPYSDAPTHRGHELMTLPDLQRTFASAHAQGFQIAVHAIGDAALRNCIAALAPLAGHSNPLNHRIEHAAVAPPDCVQAMAKHRLWAVVQPQFRASDTFLESRLGPRRAAHAYDFPTLLHAGVPMALSSDAPIEPIDPAATLACALESGLTTAEAADCYTRAARTVCLWS